MKVNLSGIYPEKVFNLFSQNRINVWNSSYHKGKISLYINVKDFKKLPLILKKSGIKVHILKKIGFPFFINKYKKRFGIFIGIIIFFALLEFLSSFIWIIDTQGNKTISYNEIVSVCQEIGVEIGTPKRDIKPKEKVQQLLLKVDELSWGSLNIEGCRLTVNVTEVTEKKEDNSVATNLKSKTDGVITKIDVTSGNCVVKVGDYVKKGDLLVSGIWENLSQTKFVHSIGSIKADTEKIIIFKEPFIKDFKYPTGKYKNKKVLEFFFFKIPLYIGKTKGNFETKTKCESLKLFSQKMPITIYEKEFVFYKSEKKKRSCQEVCQILEKELENSQKEKGFSIKNFQFEENQNEVILKATVCQNEEITYSENLTFTIGN